MIDFHSHILPSIDDGSQSIEETYKLIEEAKNAGFTEIVTTSHYIEGYYEKNVAERKVWIKAINDSLEKNKNPIRLCIGNEVYFSENIIELLEQEKATTINESSYLLFEFPLNSEPLNIYDVVYDLMQYKLVPVLAHPERYSFIQKEPSLIYELIQSGVLMQVNYGSFVGLYNEKAQIIAKKMLENDLIHFLGSDAHGQDTIYPRIPLIIDELKNISDLDKLKRLTTTNPKLALNNKRIDIGEPKKIELSIKEKLKLMIGR